MLTVRGRRGRGLARFWMTLAFGNTLVSCLLPQDLARLPIQAVNLPRVLGKVGRWLDVAEEPVAKDCVSRFAHVPGDGRIRTVRHAGSLRSAESGPILRGSPDREPQDGKDGEDSRDHFVTTL